VTRKNRKKALFQKLISFFEEKKDKNKNYKLVWEIVNTFFRIVGHSRRYGEIVNRGMFMYFFGGEWADLCVCPFLQERGQTYVSAHLRKKDGRNISCTGETVVVFIYKIC